MLLTGATSSENCMTGCHSWCQLVDIIFSSYTNWLLTECTLLPLHWLSDAGPHVSSHTVSNMTNISPSCRIECLVYQSHSAEWRRHKTSEAEVVTAAQDAAASNVSAAVQWDSLCHLVSQMTSPHPAAAAQHLSTSQLTQCKHACCQCEFVFILKI